ncbi:MAG: hypothetical protein M0R06_09170 [Sphaerochaeta sp.]|jgi:hypothetical protein|nr:hypothetical protein [Sphaerochaeta sp.]
MLMEDEWYGHRDWRTGEPEGDRTEWVDWDFALVSAFSTIEAYTDQNGIRQWQKEDPEERIDAIRKIDPFNAGRDRIVQSKNYKAQPGEYFIPDMKTARPNKEFWTYQDWVESQQDDAVE